MSDTNSWIPCPLGCGFSHINGDPKPRHNPDWTFEELKRLNNVKEAMEIEIAQLDETVFQLRAVNSDLLDQIDKLNKKRKWFKW